MNGTNATGKKVRTVAEAAEMVCDEADKTGSAEESPPRGDAELTRKLRHFLLRRGASLVGFGDVSRMKGAPEIQRPERYLPEAKTMISIALHVNEGCCDHVARKKVASWHSFQIFTLGIVNPSLDRLSFEASSFLEDRGHIAYPFPANSPHIIRPTHEYPGGPGDISHKHVAVACGLGELGWHTMLLTPEFGTRQKITTLLTTAALVPDPVRPQGALCDPEECGYQCAHACPTAAIPEAKTEEDTLEVQMDGTRLAYGKLIGWRCRWGCSGMLKSTGGYKNIPLPRDEPTEEELLQYKARMDPWQLREHTKSYAGLVPYCGKCLCVCPVKQGKRPFEKGAAGTSTDVG